jgi:hypothetical protein
MKVFVAAVAAAVVAATFSVGAASAEPATVSLVACVLVHGGTATVPAGSTVTFRFGWLTREEALAEQFLQVVDVTASVDGVPVADANSYWTDPASTGSGWLTNWLYPTGITLGAGDSLTLTWDATLSHPVADGFGGVASDDVFGAPVTCTVTGV